MEGHWTKCSQTKIFDTLDIKTIPQAEGQKYYMTPPLVCSVSPMLNSAIPSLAIWTTQT